jgi:hypothetical protein
MARKIVEQLLGGLVVANVRLAVVLSRWDCGGQAIDSLSAASWGSRPLLCARECRSLRPWIALLVVSSGHELGEGIGICAGPRRKQRRGCWVVLMPNLVKPNN